MSLKNKGATTTKNEKIVIYVLGILAAAALCYLFIISPANDKNKPITNEIESLNKQLEEVKYINFEIDNKKKELESLESEFDKATEGLPKTDRYPQVFKDVENMVVECGLTSTNIKFGDVELVKSVDGSKSTKDSKDKNTEFKGLKSMLVEYTVEDDMDKVINFVEKLEKYNRIADINVINQSDKGITVKVYFYTIGGSEKEEYDFN